MTTPVIYGRPGVYETETLAAPPVTSGVSVSNGCFVAPHPRGPLTPTFVASFQDFVKNYGGFVVGQAATDMLYAVYQFFNNGGRGCWITRVPDGNEVAASLDLIDGEPTGSNPTTPRTTLSLAASNPGTWGNTLAILLTISPNDATRFSIQVFLGGTDPRNVVERFSDLTMDPTDPRYVSAVVNAPPAHGGSSYLVATDSGLVGQGVDIADATPIAVTTATVLTGGVDATGAPSTNEWDAALALLNAVDSPVNLNLPGITSTTLINKALAYANGRGDVFVVIDGITASGQTPPTVAGAVTQAKTYTATNLSYGAVYFPRPVISDPASAVLGATKVVPPGGAVLGIIAATDAASGVQQTPAGLQARISTAIGLEISLSNSDLDTLNTSMVNAIRSLPGAGIVLFGGRTLTTTGKADKYISVRRTLIYVKAQLAALTQFAVFQPNSAMLWQQVFNVLDQFFLGFWQAGGLTGDTGAQAYYVICDDSNNIPQTIGEGELHIDVGVAPQKPAEFIAINVSQYDGQVTVTEAA